MPNLTGLLGLVAMITLAWSMSSHKRKFPWRIVLSGLALQSVFAYCIIVRPEGKWVFRQVNDIFVSLLESVNEGSAFLFGQSFLDEHRFAFSVLPTIIFFSAFMAIFYHFGIIQKVVGLLAAVMQKTLGTSGAETLSSAANIFVGQTEAPLVIRPYISTMTKSELNAVMVGGFATMAGGILGALSSMGIDAGHLLAASVISAPGALLIAKVMQPEIDTPKTRGSVKIEVDDSSVNVLEAIAKGTTGGLGLAMNVGAMLIVFLALIAVINGLLGWSGGQYEYWAEEWFGVVNAAGDTTWSLQAILSTLFYPLAWLVGIESADCSKAAELMGMKMATNEFIAYTTLSEWTAIGADGTVNTEIISERTGQIMTYALCGFANFSSIGIQLGGIGGIAPERRGDLAQLGLRAMLGGTLTAFMTGCIASLLL